jgi:hypothetical protein
MAKKKMTVELVKKGAASAKLLKASAAAGPVVGYQILDNGDATFTIFGKDSAGNRIDISGVATAAATSDAPTIVTVDAPVGMTSAIHAVGPVGSANLTVVATWTDGSLGPDTLVQPVTTVANPASVTGLDIQFGTPTTH